MFYRICRNGYKKLQQRVKYKNSIFYGRFFMS
jgi:hypothetical protein